MVGAQASFLRLLPFLLLAACASEPHAGPSRATFMQGAYATCNEQETTEFTYMVIDEMQQRGQLAENFKLRDAQTKPERMIRDASDAHYEGDLDKACDILWDVVDTYQLTLK